MGLGELNTVRENRDNKRIFCVLIDSLYSEEELMAEVNKYVPTTDNSKRVSMYTYPNPMPILGFSNLSSPLEVITTYKKFDKESAVSNKVVPGNGNASRSKTKIQLTGIHSINKDMVSRKEITRINISNTSYERIYYYSGRSGSVVMSNLYGYLVEVLRDCSAC